MDIEGELTNVVSITDFNDNYRIYHYNKLPDNPNDDLDAYERGVIRDSKGNILCKSFSFTPELFSDQRQQINEALGSGRLSDKFKFYKAEEVTLIRAWFHDNRWHLSTHKKIDAYNSRWSSQKSYGELFCEAIHHYVKNGELKDKILYELDEDIMDCFFATLRTDRVYAFLLRTNNDNRIVCKAPTNPTIYLAGEFDTNTFKYTEENSSGISRPDELFFSDIESLFNNLDNTDTDKFQGIMVYSFNEYGELEKTIKLTSKNYMDLYHVRGNCPSLIMRYIEIRNDPITFKQFIELYPEHTDLFNEIENSVLNLIINTYSLYVQKYINKQYIKFPKHYVLLLKDLHNFYLQDRKNNKITYDIVDMYINCMSPSRVIELVY